MKLDVTVSSPVSASARCRQLEAMFDVPRSEVSTLRWQADVPIETRPWSVGLIVGPSGAGKSTAARHLFPGLVDTPLSWGAPSVIDDFKPELSMEAIAEVCQAVGFNTIPAWLRPFGALSTGEKFRVELARRLLEGGPLVVVDEFTSVVDRQVAKIGAHAAQKWVRRQQGKRFVAVTCHHDVEDWLNPDWVFEPATATFRWRELRRRPQLAVEVSPVPWSLWPVFAPFHYLTSNLHRAARCWALFVDGQPAAFAGMLRRPHAKVRNVMGCSRLVTLPDYQGLGLAFVLIDTVASLYAAAGEVVHTYPAHPALVRSFGASKKWRVQKEAGSMGTNRGPRSGMSDWRMCSRPNAVFRYVGPTAQLAEARRVLSWWKDGDDA